MRNPLVKKPVSTIRWDYSAGGQSVTTSAWKQIAATFPSGASAMEIFDSSGSIFKMSQGTSGQEDNNLIPYTITPGGSAILLPCEVFKSKRFSIKAIDATASVGYLIINFFG